jgi:hypothetical protein
MPGKLHELLAVEGDLEGTFKRIVEEAINTLAKKPDHFIAMQKKLEMFDDEKKQENLEERKEMVTTVLAKMDYVAEHSIRYFDAVYQKEKTNQKAVADLVVDGNILATNIPATFLLGMETKLKRVRELYESAPTLQPGIKWDEDSNLGIGVYSAVFPDIKLKTAKTFQHKILVAPTDKHPAQIEKWEEQIPVGKYTTTTQCSMLTPLKKSIFLGKIDKLIQACKQARQRANTQEVEVVSIGKQLFDYINS